MAPEQLRGESADRRTDIWAVGAVLYELATGKRPFPETHGPLLINAILNQEPELPCKRNPGNIRRAGKRHLEGAAKESRRPLPVRRRT